LKSYEKKFLTIVILVMLFCVAMTIVSINNASAREDNMTKCRRKCLDFIDMDECINDEIKSWDNINIKEAIKDCKFLIRQEYCDCMEECKDQE
jgi:Na+/H+ antiporter NhaC